MIERSVSLRKTCVYSILIILVAYVVVRSLAGAAAKPFWYDELMTLTVSAQGTWRGIVAVQREALDSNPPLFYVIEHVASRIVQNQEIALRLPSILAFPCTLVCVFVFCLGRSGEVAGLICAAFLMVTELFQYYAVEARPYSMVVACIAFALVCYQRVPSKIWTVLFALTLALAQCLHYYAVFAMVPFGLGELVYSLRARKIRWSVWAALAAGCVPLALFWPLLAAIKSYYGAHNWMRLHSSAPYEVYGALLGTRGRVGVIIAAVVLAVLFTEFLRKTENGEAEQGEKARQLALVVVLGGFVLLPFLGSGVAHLAKSGLIPRYVLCTLLGIAAGLAFLLRRAGSKLRVVLVLLLVASLGVGEARFWTTREAKVAEVKSYGATREKFIEEKGYGDLPVVVPGAVAVVPLAHYADVLFAKRLVFVKQDPEPGNPHFSDSVDRELELYQRYSSLKVSTFDELAGTRSAFLIYSEIRYSPDWLLMRLSDEGWAVKLLASKEYTTLYLARRDQPISATETATGSAR